MRLPTFIVGGAPRCGTTALYDLLDAHPDVFMARPRAPEPKFFLVDAEYEKGLEYYAGRYFAAAHERALGEKSTNYLEHPLVAERIYSSLPDVAVVFILRDPIERAFSNYLWSRRNALEELCFEEAIRMEARREATYPESMRYSRPHSYLSRGMYARLLRPYFTRFDRGKLKVVLLEELITTPEQSLGDLFRFLGVSPQILDADVQRRINSAREKDDAMSEEARELMRQTYHGPNRDLEELLERRIGCWQ